MPPRPAACDAVRRSWLARGERGSPSSRWDSVPRFDSQGRIELEHDPDRRRKDYRVRCDAYWEGAARVLHDLEGGSS